MMGKHGGYASMHTGGGGVLFLQGHYDFFILICICICFCFGVEDENSFWNWLQIATQERVIKTNLCVVNLVCQERGFTYKFCSITEAEASTIFEIMVKLQFGLAEDRKSI